MKPFVPYKIESLYHAEDTLKIMEYLKKRGTVNVAPRTIERLYEEFSDIEYDAGWMRISATVERFNDDCELEEISILEEFAEWLAEVEL